MRLHAPLCICCLFGLAGCDPPPLAADAALPDLAAPPLADAGPLSDLGSPVDLAALPVDLAVLPDDLAVLPDLVPPPDQPPPEDMACPARCWAGCDNGACVPIILRCHWWSAGSDTSRYSWVTDTGVYTQTQASPWGLSDPPPNGTRNSVMLDPASLADLKAAIHSVVTGNAGYTTNTYQSAGYVKYGSMSVSDKAGSALVCSYGRDGQNPQMETSTYSNDPMAKVTYNYRCY